MRVSSKRPLLDQAVERLEAGAPQEAIALALLDIGKSLAWFLDVQDDGVELEQEPDTPTEVGGEA